MFWSSPVGVEDSIAVNNAWMRIDQGNITVSLLSEMSVLVSYSVGVVATNDATVVSPLPQKNLKETLQVRCVVNDVPYRTSSSLASTHFVNRQAIKTFLTPCV